MTTQECLTKITKCGVFFQAGFVAAATVAAAAANAVGFNQQTGKETEAQSVCD